MVINTLVYEFEIKLIPERCHSVISDREIIWYSPSDKLLEFLETIIGEYDICQARHENENATLRFYNNQDAVDYHMKFSST